MTNIQFVEYYSSGTDNVAAVASNGKGFVIERKGDDFGTNAGSIEYYTINDNTEDFNFKDTSLWDFDGTDSTKWDNILAEAITFLTT